MITRREFTAAAAMGAPLMAAKPNSRFGGVQIGAITYSFRSLPSTADDIVQYCTQLGISSVELMSEPAEAYAGAPAAPRRPRGALTPEQKQDMRHSADARKKWRLAASMDKYAELRKKFNGAGIDIAIFKLPITAAMSDDECEYIFNVTKALGARCITMELPNDPALSKRAGEFAARHKIHIGYHNHMQVNPSSWETALAQSPYNSINLDVGHFSQAVSASPIPFIRQNASRITSFHLKDKKYGINGGGNVAWGSGETGLREILQLMKKEKYAWPANIELEYDVPEGSTVMAEMEKCVRFCKDALA